ncbi:unnamed protein product [Lactuca virosa]|uniref:Myb/SANT-like domain-containing protein n=1 Tax=Lactuca virosa TaxID=75947 RepID=A0AAU9PNZ2_9ASTR|nr:unnamed protein product [Lactuca virosa]
MIVLLFSSSLRLIPQLQGMIFLYFVYVDYPLPPPLRSTPYAVVSLLDSCTQGFKVLLNYSIKHHNLEISSKSVPSKSQETNNVFPPSSILIKAQASNEFKDAWYKAFTRIMPPKKDTEEWITWNNENTVKFCEVCIDYITKNGCGQLMRWQETEDLFIEKVGKQFNFKSLKNKYDSMKKDWRLWKIFKKGETGLGWNLTTGKLDCSHEWWDRKLKEKPDAKKYQKGVYPFLEEKWDHLFCDAVATRVGCVAPSLNLESVDKSINDIDETENENVVTGNRTISDVPKQNNKSTNTKKDDVGPPDIKQIMEIMNRIAANEDFQVSGDVWCHAMLMFRDTSNRDIFFEMPSDDARLAWLKFSHTRNTI